MNCPQCKNKKMNIQINYNEEIFGNVQTNFLCYITCKDCQTIYTQPISENVINDFFNHFENFHINYETFEAYIIHGNNDGLYCIEANNKFIEGIFLTIEELEIYTNISHYYQNNNYIIYQVNCRKYKNKSGFFIKDQYFPNDKFIQPCETFNLGTAFLK